MKGNKKSAISLYTKELDEIIKYFESEEIDLDEAIEKYERASELVDKVNEVLKKYEIKVNKISSRGHETVEED